MKSLKREEKLKFIFETGRAMRFYMDRVAAEGREELCGGMPEDLTPIQMKAALEVWLMQPVSLGALAERLRVKPSAASALVEKLVEKGVLTREADPEDRRRVVIRVHGDAERAMEEVNARFLEAFNRIARQVSPENVENWFKVMREIRERLDEESKHE